MSTSSFDVGAKSDAGRQRQENEDSYERSDRWLGAELRHLRVTYGRLYVVADGVGGQADGKLASTIVVKHVMQYYYDEANPEQKTHQRLRWAIQRASHDVHASARERNCDMASTVVAALITDKQVIVANVGDSPALLIRRGQGVQKLSTDHIGRGSDGLPALTQSMGDEDLDISFFTTDFRAEDILIICTDGLTNLLSLDEIEAIVGKRSSSDASQSLIQAANARGGHDNITALVIRHRAQEQDAAGRGWRIYPLLGLLIVAMTVLFLGPLLGSRIPVSVPGLGDPASASPSPPTRSTASQSIDLPTSTLVVPTDTPTAPPTFTPTIPMATAQNPTVVTGATPPIAPASAATVTLTVPVVLASPTPLGPAPELSPTVTETLQPAVTDTPSPVGRSFQARAITAFEESGDSGQRTSCVRGVVRDRAGKGIEGAIVGVNNGGQNVAAQTLTTSAGSYELCNLGYSRWAVVLVHIPGAPPPEAIAITYLNGAPEQQAVVDFTEL